MKIRTIENHELPLVLELIREAFTYYGKDPEEANGLVHLETFEEVYERADLDLELIIVAEEDGKLVSMCSLLPKRLVFAGVELTTAILSPVGTLPGYRGQALAEKLIRFGLERAKAKGYVFSHVLGHPTYYPRVGYVPVFPFHYVECNVQAGDVSKAAAFRPASTGDLPHLAALYDKEHEHDLMKPIRTESWWQRELGTSEGTRHSFVVKEHRDLLVFTAEETLIGYANLSESQDALIISECCLLAPEHTESVRHALLQEAARRQKPKLKGPYKNLPRLAAHLRQHGAEEISYAPSAWMLQVLDWKKVLGAYAKNAPLARLTGVPLTLAYEDSHLQVTWGSRSQSIAISPQALTQLLMGTFAPEELVESDDLLRLIFMKDIPFFNHNETLQ